jgi:hypothetical protein
MAEQTVLTTRTRQSVAAAAEQVSAIAHPALAV